MIIQTLEELEDDLRNDVLRPVYLLLGPEIYLCQLALSLLKSKVIPSESAAFDYSEFSAAEGIVDHIIAAANTFPMVCRKRLVLVRDAEALQDTDQEALLQALERLSPRGMVIFFAKDLDHRKKFYRVLREKYFVIEFPKLKGFALEQWATSYVRRQGYKCSATAIRKIVELAGSDLQTVAAEMEKLLLYAGKEKAIPDDAVDDLVGGSREQSIFEFIEAVANKDRNVALKSLANLLSMGEHPLVVVTMMARHCRQVLIAKDCLAKGLPSREIASAAQVPSFILETFLRQARSISPSIVQEIHMRLADIDRRLKSSAADGRILLEHLICSLV